MASQAAYANPGTDPDPYASSYRVCERPDSPTVSFAEAIANPGTDLDPYAFSYLVSRFGSSHRTESVRALSDLTEIRRHGRTCSGHPRGFRAAETRNVDARNTPGLVPGAGHDGGRSGAAAGDTPPPERNFWNATLGRERLDSPTVSFAETIAAPMDLAVFQVWVDGTLHRLREAERISAWTEDQAVTAKPERLTAEEMPVQLPAEIETSIAELVDLPRGWDGYTGLPRSARSRGACSSLYDGDQGVHAVGSGHRSAIRRRIAARVVRRRLRG